MLSRTSFSVVEVIPTGLFKAMNTMSSIGRGSSMWPFTLTLSPPFTWSPTTALRPLIKTVPCSINRSASRLEHKPVSLINLFKRTESCCMVWLYLVDGGITPKRKGMFPGEEDIPFPIKIHSLKVFLQKLEDRRRIDC